MKILLLTNIYYDEPLNLIKKGSELDLPNAIGKELIAKGYAKRIVEQRRAKKQIDEQD